MGFDMQEPSELQKWMIQTFAFAVISNGDDTTGEDTRRMVTEEVLGKLTPQPQGGYAYREVVTRAIEHATSLIREDSIGVDEEVPTETIQAINMWMLKTAAAVCISLQIPFTHEKLEHLVSENIISAVQGNKKRPPSRADLDYLVRRTLAFAKEKLI